MIELINKSVMNCTLTTPMIPPTTAVVDLRKQVFNRTKQDT